MELPELYEMLEKFKTFRGSVYIVMEGEKEGVWVDNSLAQMACCVAREQLRREIAVRETEAMRRMENEDLPV